MVPMTSDLSALDRATPDRYDPGAPTPAALVSGEVPASAAPHPLSVFDMFRIGIGPSSSHTVGPMRAGLDFTGELATLPAPARLEIDLFGSLGATGRGHDTDRAVLLGLAGYAPETVTIAEVEGLLPTIAGTGALPLPGGRSVPLDVARDIRFLPRTVLPYHVNALTLTARGPIDEAGAPGSAGSEAAGPVILTRTYYSVGGGFVMVQTNDDPDHPEVASLATGRSGDAHDVPAPHPFASGAQLLEECRRSGLGVSALVRRNEESVRAPAEVDAYLDAIADTMFDCIDAGTSATGILPGGLDVPRRARALALKLAERAASGGTPAPGSAWASTPEDPMRAMDWVNLFALAVNEENAAGHRIVTAPTNGAAGVVPAVLGYLVSYCPEAGASIGAASGPCEASRAEAPLARIRLAAPPSSIGAGDRAAHGEARERRRRAVHDFLLAATAIGALIKTNASIAGAEVGCQGEVGSASAMAAAGLAEALGGTPEQVENAAEIAMEHSLGLTCDPVAGLVQIPCIERNAIAAVKAINAARMALWSDGRHQVSFDAVIETMRQTGNDMLSKYKETSAGGLAVNVVEC
ncbi:L-serine ammonia-lyase, iron-sulfur-dependent, subunit alpha [Actinomyces culturomici]